MDIVNRLKFFMESQRIANSQFADTCRIPRPTLSQLLNGRNKKISDELISKIHQAYPSLSVLWLMFGEGDMIIGENTRFSEAQNELFPSDIDNEHSTPQTINFLDTDDDDSSPIPANSFEATPRPSLSSNQGQHGANSAHVSASAPSQGGKTGSASNFDISDSSVKFATDNGPVSLNPDSAKKITRILVFYNDNSFQEFTPTPA